MNEDPIIRFSLPEPQANKPEAKGKARGLGRGLGALLGETRREEPLVTRGEGGVAQASRDGLAMLAVADIAPHPHQPRRHFDEEALDELAGSIAQRGVIQPVIVRPAGTGAGGREQYQLVAGERRWRAAQRAQLHEIPALIRDLDEREVMALALIENLQREDLNPIEEARAYQRLAEHEGMTQAEIAKMVDKSRSHVANFQRLLSLPGDVVTLVERGELSMGHARALIGCDDAARIAQDAVAKRLSVREVEKLVRKQTRGTSEPRRARTARDLSDDADLMAVQAHLEDFLGMSVRIDADGDPRSGLVRIRYASLDQLDLLCQRLTGEAI
ncbi:MAG TPA: ParB/RepB/Spo0J family partition protein [Novosphingobium sp.]|nr:ParB/RepB/Spo0J family partition protein [Novosphingobium sp.]